MRVALAAFAVGTVALTALPAETTTAAFTATASADGSTAATAALPALSGVAAVHDAGGGAVVMWDELGFRPDAPTTYRIERTVDGHTTVIDGDDGVIDETATTTPLGFATASVTDISVGNRASCVVASGQVFCWGEPDPLGWWAIGVTPGHVGGALAGRTATQVSVGTYYACAIADGDAYCWGYGAQGQLGGGNTATSQQPIKVQGLLAGKTVTAIDAGSGRTCAVADGRAYCWGSGQWGGNGDGTTANRTSPVAVGGALASAEVTDISVGSSTCAVADGQAYCWGLNYSGTIGDGTNDNSSTPVAVSTAGELAGRTVTEIAASDRHTCAVADARVFCWGENADGQLGDGTGAPSTLPVAVVTSGALAGRPVASLAAGYRGNCVIADEGAYCWGRNAWSQLGDGTTTTRLAPVAATVVSGTVAAMTPGSDHSCVIVAQVASCWGQGTLGYLGTGMTTHHTTPQPIDASDLAVAVCEPDWRPLRDPYRCGAPLGFARAGFVDELRIPGAFREASQLSAGTQHSCAVAGGVAVCWGNNQIGQLGDGSLTARTSPIAVEGLLVGRTVTAVSAGSTHSCAIADSRAYCWGSGSGGQLGHGATGWSAVPVAVGGALANATVTDISAGSHTCAVAEGRAYCWGSRYDGVLGDGQTTGSATSPQLVGGALTGLTVTRVLAVSGLSCAIAHPPGAPLATTVYCWGTGASGQLGNGATTASLTPTAVTMTGALAGRTVTEIAAASFDFGVVTVCVIADADPFCWGGGGYGQLGNGSTGDSSVPVAVTTGAAIAPGTTTAIDVGTRISCAVADGAAYCWGTRADTSSSTPVTVDTSGALAGMPIHDIGFGSTHGCVIADVALHCWGGSTSSPLLGNGTTGTSAVPVPVDTSGVLTQGGCPPGWNTVTASTCAPGPGSVVSYRVSYLKAGWASPFTTASAQWRVD